MSSDALQALLELSDHLRRRLTTSLESGMLPIPCSPAAIRSVLGVVDEGIAAALEELARMGVAGSVAAAWIRSVEKVAARTPRPDLVWSGPEVPGVHARDTRRVFEELIGSAQRSIWISSYVYFNGPRAFESLARRMAEVPTLSATLLLNIGRPRGDTSEPDSIVRRFAERFWGRDWPGVSKPRVFYDPRSVQERSEGVLHAKAVVVDDEIAFVTSANLTEAALDRNFELGLLHRDRALALAVASHFRILIERGLLKLLPPE